MVHLSILKEKRGNATHCKPILFHFFDLRMMLGPLQAGIVTALRNELLNLPVGTVGEIVIGDDQFNDQEQEQTFDDIRLQPTTNLLSSISMIAPSPDWFSGFYNVNMKNEFTSTWLRSIMITVYPWDSGTEMGDTYTLGNPSEMPHVPITQLTIDTIPNTTNVFLDPTETTVLPVGVFACTLSNEPVCKQLGICMSGIECCSGRCANGVCLRPRPNLGKTGQSFGAKTGRGGAAGRVRGGATASELAALRTQPLGNYDEVETSQFEPAGNNRRLGASAHNPLKVRGA